MANRKESAADVRVLFAQEGKEIVVERLTVSKDIEITQIYGSGRTMPDSYSVDQISYEGTIELQGNKTNLEKDFFDSDGIPVEFQIVIEHMNGEVTSFHQALATSEGYELTSGDPTTTTFEFVAMAKGDENEPSNDGDGE